MAKLVVLAALCVIPAKTDWINALLRIVNIFPVELNWYTASP